MMISSSFSQGASELALTHLIGLGSVCFVVKYFLENILKFAGVCFTVK